MKYSIFYAIALVATLSSTNPAAARNAAVTKGFLTVYSATETIRDGDLTQHYYPHTGYSIYEAGNPCLLRFVPNHVGNMDEEPMVVALPPGSYLIVAEDEAYGRVRIPVKVESSRSITINLERNSRAPISSNPIESVKTTKGRVVGYVE